MAHTLSLSEDNFSRWVRSLEEDALFRKYFWTDDDQRRLFSYQRPKRTGVSSRLLELKEELLTGSGLSSAGVSVEEMVEERRELISVAQRIGQERFRKHFLLSEGGISLNQLATECGLTLAEVENLMTLVNRVALESEFFSQPDRQAQPGSQSAVRIAEIERTAEGELVMRYTSLKYARGRFGVDYAKLERLKNDPSLPPGEFRALKQLVRELETVNLRKATLHRIMETLLEKQKQFFLTQDPEKLESLTQHRLSELLGLHPSTVSRAVAGKAVLTPWREEMALKTLLARGRGHVVRYRLLDLLEQEEKGGRPPLKDDEMRLLLEKKYGMKVALRTLAKYRHQLKWPNLYVRRKATQKAKGS